jgi:hypothetical protein
VNDTALVIVLWGSVAIFLGWTWVPALIAGLGGTRFRIDGTEDPVALQSAAAEPGFATRFQQITNLGYEPLGVAQIRLTFYGSAWRFDIPMRVFWSRTRKMFAFYQQQPRPMDSWWLISFATCWSDDGLLLTNNAVDESPSEGQYVVQGIEANDPAAVEALHLATRDRLQTGGKQPIPNGSLETLLAAIRGNAASAARYVSVRLAQTYLATRIPIHLVLSAPVAYMNGLGHWLLPAANLGLSVFLIAGEQVAKRRAGKLLRTQSA